MKPPEDSSRQSYPPRVQKVWKTYRLYLRGDLRGAYALAQAMLERDPADRFARRMAAKIDARQQSKGISPASEGSSPADRIGMGGMTLIAASIFAALAHHARTVGLDRPIDTVGKDGRVSSTPVWVYLVIALAWSLASLYIFIMMLLNRKR